MRVRMLVVAAAGFAVACSSGAPKPKLVGDAPELGAQLAITDTAQPPREVTVQLAQPSSAVLVYVVPGQGASLVYPADTLHSARIDEGAHVVRPAFPKIRALRLDTLMRDSGRVVDPSGRRPTGMTPYVYVPQGYLMLVATRASLDPATVARRLQGVTIPGEDTEALNAVGKLVRSTAAVVAPWTGVAVPVKLPRPVPDSRSGRAANRR